MISMNWRGIALL